jgi:hypothetical protein
VSIQTIVGSFIGVISTLAIPLIWISGAILLLLTAITAFILADAPADAF